jgi:hypothetical protein
MLLADFTEAGDVVILSTSCLNHKTKGHLVEKVTNKPLHQISSFPDHSAIP